MLLSQELLTELKDILREDFGKEFTKEELFEIGNSLVLYFDLLARINFRDKFKNESCKKDNAEI